KARTTPTAHVPKRGQQRIDLSRRAFRPSHSEPTWIQHPLGEPGINGVGYEGPYKLAGIAMLAGGGWRLHLSTSVFLSVEAMLTAAQASPTMPGPPDARITLRNVAVHGLAGIGYEFQEMLC